MDVTERILDSKVSGIRLIADRLKI